MRLRRICRLDNTKLRFLKQLGLFFIAWSIVTTPMNIIRVYYFQLSLDLSLEHIFKFALTLSVLSVLSVIELTLVLFLWWILKNGCKCTRNEMVKYCWQEHGKIIISNALAVIIVCPFGFGAGYKIGFTDPFWASKLSSLFWIALSIVIGIITPLLVCIPVCHFTDCSKHLDNFFTFIMNTLFKLKAKGNQRIV